MRTLARNGLGGTFAQNRPYVSIRDFEYDFVTKIIKDVFNLLQT